MCINDCFRYIHDPNVLVTILLDILSKKVNVGLEYPFALSSLSCNKLIFLVTEINKKVKDFELILLEQLEKKVFCLKSEAAEKLEVANIYSLTHFYIRLSCKNKENYGNKSLNYIYKAFYYFNQLSYSISLYAIQLDPHCIPKINEAQNDPLIVAIIHCITMKDQFCVKQPKHKNDLQNLIIQEYGYSEPPRSIQNIILDFVTQLEANQTNNLSLAIILISKKYGYNWAFKNVIKPHLVPLLNNYCKNTKEIEEHEGQIICCIDCISAIAKTNPQKADFVYYIELFSNILHFTKIPSVQEIAVIGLLRCSRFGTVNVYLSLMRWDPLFEVDQNILTMLATFVSRKPHKYWKRLSKNINIRK